MRSNPGFVHLLALGALLLTGTAAAAPADPLPKPAGRVILTVEGSIDRTNAPGRAEFDYAMLEGLGLVTRVIDTPWTEAGARFEGVPARVLMEHVGAEGTWAEARAANDYRVDVPLTDLTGPATLLALSKDGTRMQLRDRGPVWLLYGNAGRPDVAEAELEARMVWQLRYLNIVD